MVFLIVSGILMWLRQRPRGKLAASPWRTDDRLAPGVIAIAAANGLRFPRLLALAADKLPQW